MAGVASGAEPPGEGEQRQVPGEGDPAKKAKGNRRYSIKTSFSRPSSPLMATDRKLLEPQAGSSTVTWGCRYRKSLSGCSKTRLASDPALAPFASANSFSAAR